MSDSLLDDDVEVVNSNIGKRAFFINPHDDPNAVYSFASTIENIGINNDRRLKNFTEVTILSESLPAHHPVVGPLVVSKILSLDSMWVPTASLVIIDD